MPSLVPVVSSPLDSSETFYYSNGSERVEASSNLTIPASSYPSLPLSRTSPSSIYDVVIVTRLDLLSHLIMRPKLSTFFRSIRDDGPGYANNVRFNGNDNWQQTLVAGGQSYRRFVLRVSWKPIQINTRADYSLTIDQFYLIG